MYDVQLCSSSLCSPRAVMVTDRVDESRASLRLMADGSLGGKGANVERMLVYGFTAYAVGNVAGTL